jgi:predicted MFS family arabinose efflux permease
MPHKRTAWTVLLVAFLAGVAVTVNQFKVPPALPTLLPVLGLDMAAGGWLMSVFSVAGIFLSIPVALALNRVGLKPSGVAALCCVAAGSILGGLAGDATTMLLGRLIEGIGVSIIAVVSPALINLWFEPHERGLPMGIWAAWVPVGSVIMLNVAPVLEGALGWRAIWWFGTLFAVAALVLFGWLAAVPRHAAQPRNPLPAGTLTAAASPGSWLLALVFGAFAFGQLAYSTWAPSFLADTLSIDAAKASFYTSLLFLAGIAANVSAGWIMNHIPHRPAVPAVALALTGTLFWWGFRLDSVGIVIPYMLALGFFSNIIPTAVFTLAPETAKSPDSIGLAMAAINVVSNLSVLVGPPLLGAVVAGGRWMEGSTLLMAASLLGVLAALLTWRWMGDS